MPPEHDCKFLGHVKVELVSQYPRRWGWTIHRDAGGIAVATSDTPFFSAEEAWQTGRQALAALGHTGR
jgi:hypothetical protein